MSAGDGRRVVLVTGAAGGIGAATVARLLDDGWAVAAVDVDGDRLEALAQRLGRPPGLATFGADATAGAERVVAAVSTALGAPHALVSNAGVLHAGDALGTTDEDWARVIEHDLTGPFRMARAALPAMIAAGRGSIVNVASIAGVVGFRDRVAYSAAKAGLLGLTLALAADCAASGVRVNAVNPGPTASPMTRAVIDAAPDPEAQRAHMDARQPLGRMGQPDDVAAAIAFLIGDGAANVTGSTITVDGGLSALT